MRSIPINNEKLISLAQNHTAKEISEILNVKYYLITKRLRKLNISAQKPKREKYSPELREKMSLIKKKFYKENPDKHIWKRHDKFKSVPCEKVKQWLSSKNIQFIEEYNIPESERSYSIDIAFPDKKIGIEINGNQHYNKDGTLSEYYQKRHDYIESLDWKLYELHFSICFNLNEFEKLLSNILTGKIKSEFKYEFYIRPAKVKFCPKCNKKINLISTYCRKCCRTKRTIINFPENIILEKLVWEKPFLVLAKDFNCSDVAIKKHCVRQNIKYPPQGYWLKRKYRNYEKSLKSASPIVVETISLRP